MKEYRNHIIAVTLRRPLGAKSTCTPIIEHQKTKLEFRNWISVQIKDSLFQVRDFKRKKACRWVTKENGIWKEKKRANMLVHRRYFAMCNFADQYVFVSGGQPNNTQDYDDKFRSVERYSIIEDKWEMVPARLRRQMSRHSMCALGDSLYVINKLNK